MNKKLSLKYLYLLPILNYYFNTIILFLGKYVYYGKLLNKNEIFIKIKKKYIINSLLFFRYHTNCVYHTLCDIACIDNPTKKKRFELNYILLSYQRSRLILKFNFEDREWIDSVISVYKGANWLERECWDMFGIFFDRHPDLRRILTDYGFTNFPLRKEYPLVGYLEIRYDDLLKQLVYEKVSLAQGYRVFNFQTPWIGIKI